MFQRISAMMFEVAGLAGQMMMMITDKMMGESRK
jgi:hypothetical protein